MNDTARDDLPFRLELWDDTGTQVNALLALASHHIIGRAAFEIAERLHPGRIITLREGTRLVVGTARQPEPSTLRLFKAGPTKSRRQDGAK
jgi:hypothetical protein